MGECSNYNKFEQIGRMNWKHILCLTVFLMKPMHSAIYSSQKLQRFYNQTKQQNRLNVISLDFHDSHIMGIGCRMASLECSVIEINSSNSTSLSVPGIEGKKIRSYRNKIGDVADQYIIFDDTNTTLYWDTFQHFQVIDNDTQKFGSNLDACFGKNNSYFFILTQQKQANYPFTLFYYQYINPRERKLSHKKLNINRDVEFDKMIYNNGRLYILFSSNLLVLSANQSMGLLFSCTFNLNYNTPYTDVAANQEYLIVSHNQTIQVYNATNLSKIGQIKIRDHIFVGIQIVNCYVFATSQTHIFQFDLDENQTIDNRTHNLSEPLISFCKSTKLLYLFSKQGQTNSTLHQLNFSYSYSYSNSQSVCDCLPTYIKDNRTIQCHKNLNNSKTNNLICGPVPQNNETTCGDCWTVGLNTTTMGVVTDFVGKCMAFTSMRITPSFLLSFTGFLDDLWYYKYHRYTYPQNVQFFMKEVDIMNDLRLNPWFLSFLQIFTKPTVSLHQNQLQYTYMDFQQNDPQQVYFLHSAENTYKNNLIMNIIFWIVLRFLLLLLQKIYTRISRCYGRVRWFKKMIQALSNNTRWWVLLNSVLEMNMLKLTFDCFIQILQPSYFTFQDKLNFIATLTFLFMLFFYCLCFYPLVYSFTSKKSSEILLTKTRFSRGNFYFQCLFFVLRNFIRSFIHSFLIRNYSMQINLLAGADLVTFIFGVLMFKRFEYKIIGFFCLLYSFVFILFDSFFAISFNIECQWIGNLNKQVISFVCTVMLAGIALTISVLLAIMPIKDMVKNIYDRCKRKRIANDCEIQTKQKESSLSEVEQNERFKIKQEYPIKKTRLVFKISAINNKSKKWIGSYRGRL